ncbi:AraC-type arabinose-binding/dimerisation domain containing protein [uncultured Caudovirales phage]|uniref:AraC-type arabinose-binding/dimerisation domain containing protein n=1 Tax=uncultured Caudovirales phage TaxID=2100421 RepID=A0A6J5S818_9CAUD|nr:AraC-type arabinose-binding/dimerisation domain containing protein [uncultured Caudovirales phage]CAB4195923.1 AraC-type arabinose-binding/dimerisation domain containing protein [uncultured Caudovirales phage]CAB4205077.1 AraC-type arabinose-binding/dimerisation domain containing protein [uncultured Caudovirales phage]
MLSVKAFENLGDLRGSMYDFPIAGDVLPKHVHTGNNVHITIVARGRVKVYSHDWEIEAGAGQLLNFRPGEPHEIVALEDNTRIFNIQKTMFLGTDADPIGDEPCGRR